MKKNIPYAKTNAFLNRVESYSDFEEALKETQDVLLEQWMGAIASGLLDVCAVIAKARRFNRVRKATSQPSDQGLVNEWTVGPLMLRKTERVTLRNKILSQATKKMEMLGTGSKYNEYLRRYLHRVANFSGQDVLGSIAKATGTAPLQFRLGKKPYRNLIKARVDSLIKGLDGTSKRRMASEIIKGFEIGATKKQMVKRLTQVADDLTWKRAELIVKTETGAVAEWMRWKTAELNGVNHKQWVTLADEKVCPVCGALHGEEVRVSEGFSNGMQIPPAHARCRCFLRFDFVESLASKSVKKSTAWERLEEFLKSDPKDFYERKKFKSDRPLPCINPNALWAGGESLVGHDKGVGRRIRQLERGGLKRIDKNLILAVQNAIEGKPTARVNLIIAVIQNGATESEGDLLISAKKYLTDLGFVQICKYFGYTGKIDVV